MYGSKLVAALLKSALLIMRSHLTSRLGIGAALSMLLILTPEFAYGAPPPPHPLPPTHNSPPAHNTSGPSQPHNVPRPEPSHPATGSDSSHNGARPEPSHSFTRPEPNIVVRPGSNQDHLSQWMERHSNLSLSEQQRALDNEPGFRDLPEQVRQREHDQLVRLNSMNPQQRTRMLERNEALERMAPPQRQQYRNVVQSFASLPLDRRHMIARAVLDLRVMPPDQRRQVLDSPTSRAQFSDEERYMLSTLLTAEPYSPARAANP